MSMPFNVIYQAAYDREDEIRKESNRENYNEEQAKQTGWFATMLRGIFKRPERAHTYNTQHVCEPVTK